jgi:DNA-directed RNA polymerase specialized sigma24 family protein
MDTYGNFIWALARKFTASDEEAEAATREIFIDIWQYAERRGKTQSAENTLISLIARRRLIKYLAKSQAKSM